MILGLESTLTADKIQINILTRDGMKKKQTQKKKEMELPLNEDPNQTNFIGSRVDTPSKSPPQSNKGSSLIKLETKSPII